MNAAGRGLSWELTEQFLSLVTARCFYTGRLPSLTVKSRAGEVFTYNGIDRIDNTKGYYPENCRTCCVEVNYMKRKMSDAEFRVLIAQVYKRMNIEETNSGN
jgi:hypothetical protein